MARVLLVDHNESVLKNVRSALIQEGLDICAEAATGKQAIEQATLLKPDFVVLDYSLPDLTGVQVAYEIRQRIGNVKIVFFTLRDEPTMSAAAHAVGADAFVSKSSPGELVLALRRLIEDRGPIGLGGATVGLTAVPQVQSRPMENPSAARHASATPKRLS